ncbi:thioesterase family protein [Oceaniglobus indicus]|uniref:thioesterase family protein n=1 Tax=Oceaniglobus indicus TaxID=2047749 RepID=UPI000C1A48AA|nr:thioesterase family protein [Oceaniglobus indicus]
MYPVIRLAKEMLKFRKAPPLGLFDTHVSHHVCWPQDIDVWRELNNGRTLTLYDFGRMVLFQRLGVINVMRREGWIGTVAGSSVRYRRRVRLFHRVEMRTRIVGWDARFLYIEQSMWRKGEATSNALMRTAVTDGNGIVPMARAATALGHDGASPPLPDWIAAWAEADARRPWPPEC